MAEHPTRPESEELEEQEEERKTEPVAESLEERLRALEDEAARVREQLEKEEQRRAPDQEGTGPTTPKPRAPEDPVAQETPQPTPEQVEQAETYLRQAHLARMRGNAPEALRLLKLAESAAPTLPAVLESLGDELAAKNRWKDAQAAYSRALKGTPGSVSLERKYAEAVLKANVPVEALLAGNLGARSNQEISASARSAAIYSLLLPGVGQIVMGEAVKGAAILCSWLVALLIAFLIPNGLSGLVGLVKTGGATRPEPNFLVLLPILVAIALWLGSVSELSSRAKRTQRRRIERPQPPVNLPFE